MTVVWGILALAGTVVLVVGGQCAVDAYGARQRGKRLDARLDKILADR